MALYEECCTEYVTIYMIKTNDILGYTFLALFMVFMIFTDNIIR